jgi:hypothetical protein
MGHLLGGVYPVMDDLLFFTNYRGAVAVSYDDGETIVVPTGRRIPLTPMWVPEEEDLDLLRERLTLEQRREVGRALTLASRMERAAEEEEEEEEEDRTFWEGLVIGLDTAPTPKSELDLDDFFD